MSTWLAQTQISPELFLMPWDAFYLKGTLCSMLVGLGCGILGCFVVLKRMALIGDALSHAVLPGVVLAYMFTGDTKPIPLLIGAMLSGLVASVLINVVTTQSRTKEDSSIGIVFTALFAAGIILISALPRGTHFDLRCFLWGDPLAVGSDDLTMMAVICAAVVTVVIVLYHRLKLVTFDPLVAAAMGVSIGMMHYLLMGMLSATVVAGLKTTGVILVVAMVITPASAAYQLTNRFSIMLVLAGAFGVASAILGMSVSFVTNAGTGPSMVIVATLIFAVAVVLSPSHGIVFDRLRRRRLARHVANEDVLKAIYRRGHIPTVAYEPLLIHEVNLSISHIRKTIRRLVAEHLIAEHDGRYTLTEAGHTHAQGLVRAHRLWETYLTEKAGVAPEMVHAAAERLEHAHDLTPALDKTLGHPTRDPHGTAIPPAV